MSSGMVTFRNAGRLGNFLFETATAMAYAWDHKMEFSVPNDAHAHRDPFWHPVYFPFLVHPRFNASLSTLVIKEKKHSFQSLPWEENWRTRNIVLDGYWQTEKYFCHYRERILSTLGFPWSLHPGKIAVHVRRGDYLTIRKGELFKHPPVTKEWYSQQMAKFPGYQFVFFSDDIPWCQQQWGERSDCLFRWIAPVRLRDERPEILDLVSGSCCEHQICSASTFAWWMAWLNQNPNKRVIMPKHWISPQWGGGLDCSDIVPQEWERT